MMRLLEVRTDEAGQRWYVWHDDTVNSQKPRLYTYVGWFWHGETPMRLAARWRDGKWMFHE